ncbi:antigen like protein [Clarias magur]|uniref:Antigen like protein n=1 Tax=Clarias magur TaxID=1594786 RepID=A0A8J4UF66_CLAMG|nr:antigen like protein [Clarias magur]
MSEKRRRKKGKKTLLGGKAGKEGIAVGVGSLPLQAKGPYYSEPVVFRVLRQEPCHPMKDEHTVILGSCFFFWRELFRNMLNYIYQSLGGLC